MPDPVEAPEPAPPIRPARTSNPAFHVAWATVALAIIIGGTLIALRGLQVAENAGPETVAAVGDLLAPRIETTLRTNLALMGGSADAFLVAHSQGGHLDATSNQTLRTVLGIPLGTTRARVEWDFSVDLGIDLSDLPPGAFEVTCDEDGRRCRWLVPDPTSRPAAVNTDTMVVTVDGAPLLSAGVEQRNARELVAQVSAITERDVASPAFWSTARENVRVSLANLARKHLAGEIDPAPFIEVVFASEARTQPPGESTGGMSGAP